MPYSKADSVLGDHAFSAALHHAFEAHQESVETIRALCQGDNDIYFKQSRPHISTGYRHSSGYGPKVATAESNKEDLLEWLRRDKTYTHGNTHAAATIINSVYTVCNAEGHPATVDAGIISQILNDHLVGFGHDRSDFKPAGPRKIVHQIIKDPSFRRESKIAAVKVMHRDGIRHDELSVLSVEDATEGSLVLHQLLTNSDKKDSLDDGNCVTIKRTIGRQLNLAPALRYPCQELDVEEPWTQAGDVIESIQAKCSSDTFERDQVDTTKLVCEAMHCKRYRNVTSEDLKTSAAVLKAMYEWEAGQGSHEWGRQHRLNVLGSAHTALKTRTEFAPDDFEDLSISHSSRLAICAFNSKTMDPGMSGAVMQCLHSHDRGNVKALGEYTMQYGSRGLRQMAAGDLLDHRALGASAIVIAKDIEDEFERRFGKGSGTTGDVPGSTPLKGLGSTNWGPLAAKAGNSTQHGLKEPFGDRKLLGINDTPWSSGETIAQNSDLDGCDEPPIIPIISPTEEEWAIATATCRTLAIGSELRGQSLDDLLTAIGVFMTVEEVCKSKGETYKAFADKAGTIWHSWVKLLPSATNLKFTKRSHDEQVKWRVLTSSHPENLRTLALKGLQNYEEGKASYIGASVHASALREVMRTCPGLGHLPPHAEMIAQVLEGTRSHPGSTARV